MPIFQPDYLKKAQRDGARFLRSIVETSFDFGQYDYKNYDRFGQEQVDAALEVRREMAVVAIPDIGTHPVLAGHLEAALGGAALTFELVVGRRVAGRATMSP